MKHMSLLNARLYCMKHDSKSAERYRIAGYKYIWFNYHRIMRERGVK